MPNLDRMAFELEFEATTKVCRHPAWPFWEQNSKQRGAWNFAGVPVPLESRTPGTQLFPALDTDRMSGTKSKLSDKCART